MSSIITDVARQAIIDKLLYIGNMRGNGTYRNFFARVYPECKTIRYNNTELINEIARHCDQFSGDWGDDASVLEFLRILEWSDKQFLHFCKEYVNPVFTRIRWNAETEEQENLQSDCVDAINLYLKDCGYELREIVRIGDKIEYDLIQLTGVRGQIQSIVFAAIGKPEILLTDVMNQTVKIPFDENKYLIYDGCIGLNGLSWKKLNEWYKEKHSESDPPLNEKLFNAVEHCDSPIERKFFSVYLELAEENSDIPALLPQVYLYYDSKVQKERLVKIFDHQCMDFLMIFSDSQRVVIELDGVQHYGNLMQIEGKKYPNYIASPEKYAKMVAANRDMTIAGYEVYRFGGKEFENEISSKEMVKRFFLDLFNKHSVSFNHTAAELV